jgi:DedD protein
MAWAFWRRDSSGAGDDLPEAGERDCDDAGPAAELRARTRRRLIGAAALLLASVFLVPMLLDPTPRPEPETVIINVPSQQVPAKPPPEPTPAASARPAVAEAHKTEDAKSEATARPAKPVAEPDRTSAAEVEKFSLQVAALSTAGAANQLAARLKKAGFVAYVEPVETADGPRHRVRVGPFLNRSDAQRVGEKLRAAGFAAALVAG